MRVGMDADTDALKDERGEKDLRIKVCRTDIGFGV